MGLDIGGHLLCYAQDKLLIDVMIFVWRVDGDADLYMTSQTSPSLRKE